MSKGWTTSVATEPAVRPAMVSTKAGERPASWRVIETGSEHKMIRYYIIKRLSTGRRRGARIGNNTSSCAKVS